MMNLINRPLNERELELMNSIAPATFDEMVEEVRESLPPTRYTRSAYMRNCQGLAP